MKIGYNFSNIMLLTVLLGLFAMSSCKDDLPGAIDSSDKFTVLKSIKIVNSGEDGNTVVNGTINEDTKTITFPRLDTLSDFSNVKFEAELSNGATLDKTSYSVPFAEGESERTIVIKAVNQPRYREYFVKLRLKVPVFGADFEKGNVYDNSNNAIGNPIYPTYVGLATRGGAFDGDYVMVPSRQGSVNPHLLKVSDLKQGVINKINLNTSGITGGTLAIQTGAFANGNLYVFNVSNASGFKMYFYRDYKTNLNSSPEVITVPVDNLPPATNTRFGENTSVNLDANGNGYIYMPNNPIQVILRLKVQNYTEVVERTVIPLPASSVTFGVSFNQIGSTSQYLCTSYGSPLYVVSESGSVAMNVPSSIFEATAADARVVYFNNERYLMYMTSGINNSSATVFKVYDITRGNTIEEALTIFSAQSELARKPIYEFSLNGGANNAPITRTSWKVEKDDKGEDSKLLLFATASDAGFTIFEFPKKVLGEND